MTQDAHLRHQEILVIFERYDDKINQLIGELRWRDNEVLKHSAGGFPNVMRNHTFLC